MFKCFKPHQVLLPLFSHYRPRGDQPLYLLEHTKPPVPHGDAITQVDLNFDHPDV